MGRGGRICSAGRMAGGGSDADEVVKVTMVRRVVMTLAIRFRAG